MKADPGEKVADLEAGVVQGRGEKQWQHQFGARQSGRPEGGVDLAADPAGVDQHQPGHAIRELIPELHRDATPEGMTDHRSLGHVERDQQVAHPARVGAKRIIALRLG